MEVAKVSAKGQIVIPAKIRRKLKLGKGSKLVIIEEENGLIVVPLNRNYFDRLAGILKTGKSLAETLLQKE